MRKIVIVGLNECLGSAFWGLTDILTLARRAVVGAEAPAESAEDPFYVVTASADGESIRDRAGASFPVAASFKAITTCDAIIAPSFWPDEDGKPPDMSRFGATVAELEIGDLKAKLMSLTD
ncbi:type 1 glutamine amidotransferase family protein [Methylocystis silviterrae]|uniref:hypothetical protein n=1 Tax=Methylocystis silviterrae TaxID=2743612 RepID=UPI001E417288|nr:hypothetical protein [Methylocystis silviterrae]